MISTSNGVFIPEKKREIQANGSARITHLLSSERLNIGNTGRSSDSPLFPGLPTAKELQWLDNQERLIGVYSSGDCSGVTPDSLLRFGAQVPVPTDSGAKIKDFI